MGLLTCSTTHVDYEFLQSITAEIESVWNSAEIKLSFQAALQSVVARQISAIASQENGSSSLFYKLPLLCCEAVAGNRLHAVPVTAAWILFHAAAHLLDLSEDGEIDAEVRSQFGPGILLNISTGLMITAEMILDRLEERGIDTEAARSIRLSFNLAILRMCAGQHEDLIIQEPDLDQGWRIAEAKSGNFFELACLSGARLGSKDIRNANYFGDFGRHLGILVQIGDDLRDLWGSGRQKSDLANGKQSLPIAYSLTVLPGTDIVRLMELISRAPFDAEAELESRRIIFASGALVYLKLEALKRQRLAEAALNQATAAPSARRELLGLIERLGRLKGEPR